MDNGNHVTTLVDTYYIVGEGRSTIESLQFILPDGANVFNSEDTIINDASSPGYTYDGDSTVTVHSATVGGTLSPERVFYKVNGNKYISDHSEMIKGEDDDTTIEFVCDIIGLDIFEIDNMDTDDYLYNNYGIYRGER